jgi:hypothetical protein
MSICFLFFSDDEGEELFYKRGTEFKLPYPCLYDFDTNFNSTLNDEENYSLKHHSSSSSSSLIKSSNTNLSLSIPTNSRPTKKASKTTVKQPTINPFTSNPSSTSSSFDPYYNSYPSAYVPSYPADVTTASFIEAATNNYSTNPNNSNDLLLVNETNPYSGTYSNYYAAALQQQYQNSLTPYHAVYYQDTNNRYYTNHRTSPSTINEQNYHQPQQPQQTHTHENYFIDTNNPNNPYSYYLYNKNSATANHGHDSNNNLSLFDVSPIHHSVIKHSTKR